MRMTTSGVCIDVLVEGYQKTHDLEARIYFGNTSNNEYNYDISCQTFVIRPNSWIIPAHQPIYFLFCLSINAKKFHLVIAVKEEIWWYS